MRDTAVLPLFVDTGIRRGEMAGLRVGDVDLDLRVAVVRGKGDPGLRTVPFSDKTTEAIDRYDRARRRHPKPTWNGCRSD